MPRLAMLLAGTLLLLPGWAAGQGADTVTIGFLTDGPYQRQAYLGELLRDEIRDLLSGEFDVRMPAAAYVQANYTIAGIEAGLDSLLEMPDVDLIVTFGAISSHVAARRPQLRKPTVAMIILSPELQGIEVADGGGSGKENLSFIALAEDYEIGVFLEIVPFTRVAFLVNGPLAEAVPQLAQNLRAMGQASGLDPVLIPVGLSVEPVLAALDEANVEAVYLLPQFQLAEADFRKLVQGLIDRRLPSFSWFGRPEVVEGILAGQRPERFPQRIARRVALNIQSILLGTDASSLPVGFAPQSRLFINMATARAIGVYPPWKVVTEAELIAEQRRSVEQQWTLETAVREAVEANLDLAAAERAVAAGAADVKTARADLLPQIDVGLSWSMIDKSQAESGVSFRPERLLTGQATLTQLIYADPAWANYTIQKSVQESRVEDRQTVWLDIAFEAAVAYLDILKAKTIERIERENLRITRENLEFAEVRRSIGTASPGEVFRWESQIANNRQAVINAIAIRNLTEIELNRLLNRPLEEPFATEETELTDPSLLTSQARIAPYLANQWSFRVFRGFMAQEALDASPELKALTALAAAQRRALNAADRAFYIPTLALQASLDDVFSTGGEGTVFPGFEDLRWTVGFSLRYPLLTGGARFSVKSEASEELARIETERGSVAQRVEGRVRSAVHTMGAALASIDLSRDAADAARRNFELVQDSYSRGVSSIIELLDAQNNALVAELRASNAVYDFLIELMRVERAAGRFDFFASPESREAFFDRLDAYYARSDLQPERR
ncbi:MAG: TolC family protein [Gemmatimonadales bacterium]